ncbi:MAG: magnesium transporter [Phycisphaerae bacterium]
MQQGLSDLLASVQSALQQEDADTLRQALRETHAADIADLLEELPDEQRSQVLFGLDPHTLAEVVVMLGEATRGEVVEELDTVSLTEMVAELPPDDAADVLGELTDEESGEILEQMPDEKSVPIEQLLVYGEETAGGIMTPDIVAIPATATVHDAVDYVRDATQEEDLNEVFIVDTERKLLGTVPLRRLVTNPSSTRLIDICNKDVVAVRATDDQETVLQIIRKYDVPEAAVLDEENRLVGRVTHDDLQDVAEEEAAEDLFRMAGTDPAEFEKQSVFHATRVRLTWLLPCMVGTLLTATVLGISKTHIDAVIFIALGFFVPMLGAMGGNSGIQISTVIVRGFATGDPGASRIFRTFLREGRIAMAMSVPCGVFAFSLVYLFLPLLQSLEGDGAVAVEPLRIAMAVGSAMTCAILVAGFLGIALPFTFRRFGVDPAIASGPLVTTLNDVVSVGIYMTLAKFIAG